MMPTPWALPLASPAATLENAGGKGANLARLAAAGFPVPGGFLIPTAAYRAFVAAHNLQADILAALAAARPDDPDALQAASAAIRARFDASALPDDIAAAIVDAYVELGRPAVAVRSSATAEDLPDLSFAGQQDTYLNILGAEALLAAVRRCWGSLWTARAIGYRARNGIAPDDVALAVVVQGMVQSEAAGVLFTANPLTGLRGETVIDATVGLGEALVSGLVEPDHYVVDVRAGRIDKKTLGAKALSIRGQAGGGTSTVAESGADRPALGDAAILQLAELGQQVAGHYQGEPQDIEWAWADGRLYLLQARPITSLYPLPAGLAPDPLRVMASFGAMQGLLDPLTPLGRDIVPRLIVSMMAIFGRHETLASQQVVLTAGERLFADITGFVRHPRGRTLIRNILGVIEPSAGLALAAVVDDPRLAVQHSRPRPRTLLRLAHFAAGIWARLFYSLLAPASSRRAVWKIVDDAIARAQADIDRAESLADVLATAEGFLSKTFITIFPAIIPRIAAGMAPLYLLLRLSRELPEGRQTALEVTRGMPHNVTTEMDLALWQTALAIRADPESLAVMQAGAAAELAARYQAGRLPHPVLTAIGRFMSRYGVRGLAEIDMGRRRWREDPTPVMQALQSYLSITDPAQAPDAVFGRGAAAAQAASNRLAAGLRRRRFGRLKAALAHMAAGRTRAIAGLRELPKWTIINISGIFRARLLLEGEKLAAQGVVERADDLFFLSWDELAAVAAGAQRPWREIIAGHRAASEREWRRKQIPRLLLSDGRAFYEGVDAAAGGAEGVITGSPVSPGVVEGRVRVVLDPHQAGLLPGEILVCPGTDPSWTPLFLAAAGLVMEVGGMMTHGSVVAREYGIPAVVGIRQATTRLTTGQRVRVNGSTGEITLLDGQSA